MSVAPLKYLQLSGRSQCHLQEVFPGHFLHRDVVAAYLTLVEQAASEGFTLRLASGFRSFERQLAIWNDNWPSGMPRREGSELLSMERAALWC